MPRVLATQRDDIITFTIIGAQTTRKNSKSSGSGTDKDESGVC